MKANFKSAMKPKGQLTRRALVGTFVVLSSLLAACGSDSGSSSAPESTEVVVDAPQRIVSLSAAHTEILFAIGAGDQVVAVDSMSNYPAESAAVLTDISGYEPNVEAISALEPDLVVIGDDFSGLAEQLSTIGIASWVSPAPATFEEAYAQMIDLGAVVGHSEQATALVTQMESDIEGIVSSVEMGEEPVSYFHELDDTLYSVTSNTFIGSVYGLFGLRNIADATEGDTDYPQLSAEFIVSQDPGLIFLADTKCCGVTAEAAAVRPGWEALSAVIDGNLFALDDDVASRWGPRLVDFVQAIADALLSYYESVG